VEIVGAAAIELAAVEFDAIDLITRDPDRSPSTTRALFEFDLATVHTEKGALQPAAIIHHKRVGADERGTREQGQT
jgi:hypothetical protein